MVFLSTWTCCYMISCQYKPVTAVRRECHLWPAVWCSDMQTCLLAIIGHEWGYEDSVDAAKPFETFKCSSNSVFSHVLKFCLKCIGWTQLPHPLAIFPPHLLGLYIFFQECVDICFSLSFRYWTDMNRSSSLRFWAVGIPWYIDPPTKVIFLRASTSTTQPSWTRNSTQIFASQRMVGLAGKYLGLSSLRKDSVPSEEWVVWFDSMTLLVLMIFPLMLHGLAFDPWIEGICAGNPWIWLVNQQLNQSVVSEPQRFATATVCHVMTCVSQASARGTAERIGRDLRGWWRADAEASHWWVEWFHLRTSAN